MNLLRALLHQLGGGRPDAELFRLVVEHAPVCIHRLDLNGRLASMNPAGLRMMGVTDPDLVLGLPYIEAVSEEDRARVEDLLAQAMAGQESHFEFRASNGRRFSSNFVPIRDDDGRLVALMGITQDVTDRDEAEERLRRSEERLQLAMSSAGVIAWDLDLPSDTLEWFGTGQSGESAEIATAPTMAAFAETVYPSDRDTFDAVLRRAKETGRPTVALLRVRSTTGGTRHVEWSARARLGPDGSPERLVGAIRDATRRVEYETRRWRSQKLESLGVMAGGIAHDFNNLLTGILGNVSVALAELPEGDPARTALERSLTGAERAADLCRQLLSYSGRAPFSVEVLDLTRLVAEMSELMRIASADVTVDLVPADTSAHVRGDPTQLRQVVMNLVRNALDASRDSGAPVVVRTERCRAAKPDPDEQLHGGELGDGDYALVEIEDRGCGMDSRALASMFDPFFTSKPDGHGLGLSAVLGIVRSHGGTLAVRSAVGHGTRIRLWLPITDELPTEAPPPDPATGTARDGWAALVVDDEPLVRDLARAVVGGQSWTVLTAASGADALVCVGDRDEPIDVALIDVNMPGMSGVELARRLRALHPGLRIVLSSGYSEEDVAEHLDSGVADAFLPKPYRARALIAALAPLTAD